VVGADDGQLRVGVDVGDEGRGQAHRVRGVAGDRFEDQPVGAQVGQGGADLVAVAGRGADPDPVGGQDRAEPFERFDQQAARAAVGTGDDVEQLLGALGSRQRRL